MKVPIQPRDFDEEAFQDVIRYYDETRFDYQVAWTGRENRAVHFGFYDGHADRHAEALLNTNRMLAELAGVRPGDLVLDAGCGKGGSCFWLARHRQASAVGITPVPSQIEECREGARELGLMDQTTFAQADFCQMPFAEATFDVVWACESVCHAAEKKRFYQEAFRVLKPGGRLVMAEYIRARRPLSGSEEHLLRQWLRRWAIPDLDTAEEHQRHAQTAGFLDFNLRDYTQYTWVSLKNLHKISRRWIWIGYLLRALRIRSAVQHGNHVGSIRQFQALRKGCWFYGVITARKENPVLL